MCPGQLELCVQVQDQTGRLRGVVLHLTAGKEQGKLAAENVAPVLSYA